MDFRLLEILTFINQTKTTSLVWKSTRVVEKKKINLPFIDADIQSLPKGQNLTLVTDKMSNAENVEAFEQIVYLPKGLWASTNKITPKGFKRQKFTVAYSLNDSRYLIPFSEGLKNVFRMTPGGFFPARVRKFLMLFIEAIGLKFLLPSIVLFTKKDDQSLISTISNSVGIPPENVCLFTGTQGITRRLTLQLHSASRGYCYAKISTNEFSAERIDLEQKVLQQISHFKFFKTEHPQVLASGKYQGRSWFVQSSFPTDDYSHPEAFGEVQVSFLKEMAANSQGNCLLKDHSIFNFIQKELNNVSDKKFKETWDNYANRSFPLTHAHGDFTSWNFRIKNDKLFIFDWEAFTVDSLPLFDLFHYFVQDGILIKKQSAEEIRNQIQETVNRFSNLPFQGNEEEVDLLLLLYVTNIRIEYSKLVEEEAPGFIQVEWQKKTTSRINEPFTFKTYFKLTIENSSFHPRTS